MLRSQKNQNHDELVAVVYDIRIRSEEFRKSMGVKYEPFEDCVSYTDKPIVFGLLGNKFVC